MYKIVEHEGWGAYKIGASTEELGDPIFIDPCDPKWRKNAVWIRHFPCSVDFCDGCSFLIREKCPACGTPVPKMIKTLVKLHFAHEAMFGENHD